MISKYAIINIEVLEKRIEELDKDIEFLDNDEPSDYPERKSKVLIQDKKERAILREILSNTIPLEQELEKAANNFADKFLDEKDKESQFLAQAALLGFEQGAKWAQERLYTEEDVREMLFEALNHDKTECCVTHTNDSIVRKVIREYKKNKL